MRFTALAVGVVAAFSTAGWAEENVLVYDTFDSGKIDQREYEKGELVATPTLDGSAGALKAATLAGNQYFGIGISRNLRQRPKTRVGVALFFWYRTDKFSNFKIQINCDSKDGNIVYHFRSVPGIWVQVYLPFSVMTFGNNQSADVGGVTLSAVNIYGGKPGETFDFFIDNMALFYDAPPQPLAAVIAREKEALSEMRASLSQQRYTLSPELIHRIRAARATAQKQPNAKCIMTAGSTRANTSDFIRRMKNEGLKGYSWVPLSHGCGAGKPLSWIKDSLAKNLPKDLPEIVFIMPGIEDILANMPNDAVVQQLRDIVDLCHANGAAAVLCSTIECLALQTPMSSAAQKMNSLVAVVADEKMAPFLDASSLANNNVKKNFSGLNPSVSAYKAISARALPLYRAIERWGIERRESAGKPAEPGAPGTPEPPEHQEEDLNKVEI